MTGKDFVEILKYMDSGINEETLTSIAERLSEINNNLEQVNRELKKLSKNKSYKKYVQQELPF